VADPVRPNQTGRHLYKEIFRLAKPYLRTRQNDIHTLISYGCALKLLRLVRADENIVLPAVLLHDLGWSRVPEELQITAFGPGSANKDLNRVHEVEGAKMAAEILRQLDFPEGAVREITAIIEGHDSRPRALSANDMLVKDSDKLWRYSFKGFECGVRRFGFGVYRSHLAGHLDDWFFTSEARRLAGDLLRRLPEDPIVLDLR